MLVHRCFILLVCLIACSPSAPSNPETQKRLNELAARAGNLEVVFHSPESSHELPASVVLSFNQPMLQDPDAPGAADFKPFRMSPNVPGEIRWLGKKTVAFYPARPFPFATAFTVRVPKTTQSLLGRIMREDFSWDFFTPVPRLENAVFLQSKNTRPNPPLLMRFNQPMDPHLIQAFVRVFNESSASREIPVRARGALATEVPDAAPSSVIALELSAPPRAGEVIRVELNEKLKAREGQLPAGAKLQFTLKAGEADSAYRAPCQGPCGTGGSPVLLKLAEGSGANLTHASPRVSMMGEGTPDFLPRILFFSDTLREGDSVSVPLEVKNLSSQTVNLTILARTQGAQVDGSLRKILSLPGFREGVAHFQYRVGFASEASFEYTVTANGQSGYAEMRIPVLKNEATRLKRIKGSVGGYKSEKIRANALEGGNLRVVISPSILLWMESEIRKLAEFTPSNLGEEIARGRLFADLEPLLKFTGETESGAQKRAEDLARWVSLLPEIQNSDGGFRRWPADSESSPELARSLLELLQTLEDRGQMAPEEIGLRLKLYLLSRIPSGWDLKNPDALSRGLAVLAALGLGNPSLIPPAQELLAQWALLPTWAQIELLDLYEKSDSPLVDREVKLADILAKVFEGEREAFLNAPGTETAPLDISGRQVTARLLSLTLKIRPGHSAAPKLAFWLAQNAQGEGSFNAHEALEAARALWQFHRLHGEVPQRLRAMVQRGKTIFLEGTFSSESEAESHLSREIPLAELSGEEVFLFQKDGVGTLYYQISHPDTAPDDFRMEGNLALHRRMVPAAKADLASLKAGDRVRVQWQLVVTGDSHFVVVEEPLPSNFEVSGLRTEYELNRGSNLSAYLSHRSVQGGTGRWDFKRLPKGVYEWTYEARLRHAGEFTAPPLRAYELHNPLQAVHTQAMRLTVR